MRELDLSSEDVTFRIAAQGITVGEGETVVTINWAFLGQRLLEKVQDGSLDLEAIIAKVTWAVGVYRRAQNRDGSRDEARPRGTWEHSGHSGHAPPYYRPPLFRDDE